MVLNVVTTDITAEGMYIATCYSVQYEFLVYNMSTTSNMAGPSYMTIIAW